MKNCTHCKHAEWKKTATGRLHPSGDGKCLYVYKVPKLPACKFWLSGDPRPCGGHISRKEELKEDCVYFQRA